jgi:CRISPR/Cas system-associated exonuclease Cas4 (RecB family)
MLNNEKAIEMYEAIRDSNQKRVFEHWHASSIAECPRTQYFKRLGVPSLREVSGAKVIRWQAGHHLETAIRPIIEAVYGATGSNERMTSEGLDLTGEFDNIVLKDNRLVEIKSVHDFAFIERDGVLSLKEQVGTRKTRTGKEFKVYEPKNSPYLNHELQNHAYVLLLRELGKEVTHIDYVYISLSGRLVVYTTEVDERKLKNVKTRLEVLNNAWKTQTPPECICTPEHPLWDSTMQWCDYQERDDNGNVVSCCNLNLLEGMK